MRVPPWALVLLASALPSFVPDGPRGGPDGLGPVRGTRARAGGSLLRARVADGDPVDPRLERVRAYRGLSAAAFRETAQRVRVRDLLPIVSDVTAPMEAREEAVAGMIADVALVNDPDLSMSGRGALRPRLLLWTRAAELLLSPDEATRVLAGRLCDGWMPGGRLPFEGKGPEPLRAFLASRRAASLAALAGQGLEEIVRRQIRARVEPRDARLDDVNAWLRREAVDSAFAELADTLREWDASLTAADARALFAARPRPADGWRSASYGTGTFVVDPPPKPPPPPPRGIPVPKLPTREAWWAAATAAERLEFAWATFLETSGLYELAAARSPCPACDGSGRQTRRLSGGFVQEWICVRCEGKAFTRDVRYR